MVIGEVHIPMGINPRTGKKQYTKSQLSYLKPKWRRQWEAYTDLDTDMIDTVVNDLHTGPFEWPGTRIAEGAGKGINKFMKETAHDWKGQGKSGSQIYKEARKRLNAFARKAARAKDHEDPDDPYYPLVFTNFLTQKQRKMRRRSIYDFE